ncbi:MAG: M20/M25/M40 family metallo-hydrolase [Eubacteriales bacterium]
MERLYSLAAELTALPSVSGFEEAAFGRLGQITDGLFDEVFTTPTGSFVGVVKCGRPGAGRLIFDAHLDEIGFIVSQIHKDGFLSVTNAGGVDTRMLSASAVTVYGKKAVRGVFTSIPPHLKNPDDKNKKLELKSLYIDTGYKEEEIKEIVKIGDFAELYSPLFRLENGFIAGKSLDDKICVAQIIRAVEKLDKSKLSCDLYCAFTGGEEIGGKGATSASYAIDADWGVALDVCNPKTPESKNFLDDITVGGGCVISYSSTTSRFLTKALADCAKKHSLKTQLKGEPGRTGTNAHYIFTSRAGVPCTNLSVPLRYMHTGVEVVNLSDVFEGAVLLAKFTEELGDIKK